MNTDADRPAAGDGFHADANGTGGHSGPTSQIPGLSQGGVEGPEEKARGGRRVGVLESDSVYVKLAKQGGQKGLLWHDESKLESKPEAKPNTAYHAPDWFSGSAENQGEQPSPTDSEKALRARDAAPFGCDNMSTWERQAGDDKKLADAASGQMEKLAVTDEDKQEANKYKKTSHNKKPDPVSMSKLLGFGYAKDEKETSN